MIARVRGLIAPLLRNRAIRSVAENASWLMAERIINMVVSVGINVWMARYLGPEAFGVLNYATAFVALFSFFPYLGLDGLVTRHLVEEPDRRHELLGTAFALRMAAGTLAVGVVAAIAFARPGEDLQTRWMLVILAAGMLFDAFSTVDFWFQSRVESRYPVQARTVAALLGALLRVGLIVARQPLWTFAAAATVQNAIQAFVLVRAYRRQGHVLADWTVARARARSLLSRSWPLIISSIGGLIYLKIDQVMLGEMAGAREVGTYAVAARMSEVWYFIPTAFGASLLPMMVSSKQLGEETYRKRLQWMYAAMAWSGIALALAVSLTATPVMSFLYGARYAGADRILQVHVWSCPGMFMGAILSRWLVVEDLLTFSLTRNVVGAVVNVLLNLVLIPRYGGVGAAVATFVSYTTATYLACFTDRRTWPAGLMMTRALLAPIFLRPRAAS